MKSCEDADESTDGEFPGRGATQPEDSTDAISESTTPPAKAARAAPAAPGRSGNQCERAQQLCRALPGIVRIRVISFVSLRQTRIAAGH